MSKSLIIAEKPSVANDLARALGVKKVTWSNSAFRVSWM
jgi:DNA topoisomerase IA